jgi:hypothetical protein
MMGICPVCNGFAMLKPECPKCGSILNDTGRLMDFFDDYSPYMPIDQMKLEDGYKEDFKDGQCPHFLKCDQCNYEVTYLIKE